MSSARMLCCFKRKERTEKPKKEEAAALLTDPVLIPLSLSVKTDAVEVKVESPLLDVTSLKEQALSPLEQKSSASVSTSLMQTSSTSTSSALPHSPYDININEVHIGEWIGDGSFSNVYTGSWRKRKVAIKTLKPSPFFTIDDFNAEAKMMEQFMEWQIPCMVPYYGKMTAQHSTSLIMEYLPFNFYDELQSNLKWGYRYQAIKDVLTFAVASHQHNVLYCDFKANNVMLTRNKANGCVVDMGLAFNVRDVHSETPHCFHGTPGWTAPEISNSSYAARFSEKSDVYSLGTLLWEVAACRQPFNGWLDEAILQATSQGAQEIIPSSCPAVLSNLIKNSWFYEPEKRPTAEAMLQILEKDAGVTQAIARVMR